MKTLHHKTCDLVNNSKDKKEIKRSLKKLSKHIKTKSNKK
jgi:hypothetical protein